MPRERLRASQVETLWERMAAIYGHRWTSAYGDNPNGLAGDTWAAGLNGLSPRHLACGLEACVVNSDPWPPALPEFRATCLGIPALASVRLDSDKVMSPFTRLVWRYLDGHRYRLASAEQADRQLREAYELAREYVMRGGMVPEEAVGELERNDEPKLSVAPETRAERIQHLAKLLGRDFNPAAFDKRVATELLHEVRIPAHEAVELGGEVRRSEAHQ